MKIVFDDIVFSLQRVGGISVVWQELLSRFLKNNRNDDLICLEYSQNGENIFQRLLDFGSVTVIKKNPIFLSISRYIDPLIKSKKPFIFHSSYYRICRNKNAINITTVHDFTYDYFYKNKLRWAFLHIWQRNRAIRNSDGIVCISKNTKRDLLKFIKGIDPSKIHVIYNGVSSDYKVLSEKNSDYKDYLLFVGGRNAFKNGRFLVNSIKDTDYRILFCGKPFSPDEEEYINNTIGKGRYKVLTGIPNKELNKLYNSVKCLIYPSSYEGFGIPVIEAQSAGCPVIAYNSSSIPEIIGDTPLLMEELTPKELLSKLKLLENSAIRDNVIKKGIENAKRFSWDKTYEEYNKLYKELLEQREIKF